VVEKSTAAPGPPHSTCAILVSDAVREDRARSEAGSNQTGR